MPKKLPTKLRKEPILDAVFELRFSSSSPASNIFPGILFNKLDGKKVIEPHPIASVPKQIRDADQNLKYAPIVRIHWNEFLLLIGDQSIAIACKMPYPGWTKLKNVIVQVINIVKEVGIIEGIQRYSLKYVDLIPIADIKKQVSAVRLQVKLGDHALEKEVFQFRLEVEKDGLVNAIQIVSSAVVTTQDKITRQGLIVEIDTIRNLEKENQSLSEFTAGLNDNLNKIHETNKIVFFEWCLTPETLTFLDPVYE